MRIFLIGLILIASGFQFEDKDLQMLESKYGANSYEVLSHLKGY
jgi:hypothetical protein